MGRQRTGYVKFDDQRKVWVMRLTYVDEQGKRKDIRKTVENKTAGNQELKKTMRALDDHGGRIIDGARLTFGELADVYQEKKLIAPVYKGETRVAGLRSWKCQRGYLKSLRAYFGKQRVQTIAHSHLESYRTERLQTPTQSNEGAHDHRRQPRTIVNAGYAQFCLSQWLANTQSIRDGRVTHQLG